MEFKYKGKTYLITENVETNLSTRIETFGFVSIFEVEWDDKLHFEEHTFIDYFYIADDSDEEIEKTAKRYIDDYIENTQKLNAINDALEKIRVAKVECECKKEDKGALDKLTDAQYDLLDLL